MRIVRCGPIVFVTAILIAGCFNISTNPAATILPNLYNPQDLNRYAYVMNR